MSLLETLEGLGVLRAETLTRLEVEALGHGEAPFYERPGGLLRLCEAGALEGSLSVALDVEPDELLGPLAVGIGAPARGLKILDVRQREVLELCVSLAGREHTWEVADVRALASELNGLFHRSALARAVVILGEWQDALQLWCVEKRVLPRLLREPFFRPENGPELAKLARR